MEFLPTYISQYFNWLLDTSAMSAILAILIFIIRFLFKDLEIRWQNALWLLLIVRLLLPITPQTSFSLYNLFPFHGDLFTQGNLTLPQTINTIALKNINPTNIGNPTSEVSINNNPAKNTPVLDNVASGAKNENLVPHRFNLINTLFVIWLIGFLGFGGYIAFWQRRFSLGLNREVSKVKPEILRLFEDCKKSMQITQPVQLFKTSTVLSPTLFGLIRPRLLLLEETINVLSQEQLKHIFLHELAHLKRKDILLNWISSILLVIHWFNPVLWLAFNKMREDQEIACDAVALSYIDPLKSKEYGLTIIKLLETGSRPIGLPGMARLLGENSGIKRRIEMIKMNNSKSLKGIVIGLVLIAVLCTVGLTNAKSGFLQPTKEGKNAVEIKNIALKVAEIYKENNPEIVRVTSTQTEATYEPMYIVFLSGNFQKGDLKASNVSFSALANGQKVWALRAFDGKNNYIWEDLEINLNSNVSSIITPPKNSVDTTTLMEKYLKDHGYNVLTATGGGSLAGASIQLPKSFNAVVSGVKIGELLRQKNELSKKQNLDFSKYLGEKVSVFTWGLEVQGNNPNGLNAFFLIHDEQIVGVWFEPNTGSGEKNMTLSIFENIL